MNGVIGPPPTLSVHADFRRLWAVSIRQTALKEDVQARAGATIQVVEGISLPTGALIAGPLADVVGAGGVLWIAIAGATLPLSILSMSRLWTLRTLEESRIST